MAKFFVGQRVRLVRPVNPANFGLEGVIRNIGVWHVGDMLPDGGVYGGDVADLFVESQLPCHYGETLWPTWSDSVEPILPEGAAPSEFSFSELMDDLMAKMEGV